MITMVYPLHGGSGLLVLCVLQDCGLTFFHSILTAQVIVILVGKLLNDTN